MTLTIFEQNVDIPENLWAKYVEYFGLNDKKWLEGDLESLLKDDDGNLQERTVKKMEWLVSDELRVPKDEILETIDKLVMEES